MSGGADKEDNANEAESMRKIAIEAGIPSEDILIENKSTSTYENFAFSKRYYKKPIYTQSSSLPIRTIMRVQNL